MRALTLHQPWATLIVLGYKTIETRSWAPPLKAIGMRIAIHAGRHVVPVENMPDVWRPITEMQALHMNADYINTAEMQRLVPRGAVVATAVLQDVHRVYEMYDRRDTFQHSQRIARSRSILGFAATSAAGEHVVDGYGDFSVGRYLWLLDAIETLETPIECRGYQGLWRLPDDVAAQIASAA